MELKEKGLIDPLLLATHWDHLGPAEFQSYSFPAERWSPSFKKCGNRLPGLQPAQDLSLSS